MITHIDAPQRSPEWFAARLGRVTASEASSVLAQGKGKAEAVTRRDYRMQLVVERLTGTVQPDEWTSPALQHGVTYEPAAREAFAAVSGESIEVSGFWADTDRMIGASLDGHIMAGDRIGAVVEIKCPFKTANHLSVLREGVIPSQYVAQVTHQVMLTGAQGAHFVSYDPRLPDKLQIAWVWVPKSELAIEAYSAAVDQFLSEVDAEYREWSHRVREGA